MRRDWGVIAGVSELHFVFVGRDAGDGVARYKYSRSTD